MCQISTKDKIQSLRRRRKWTQQELADRLDISRSTIANWETGRVQPSLEALQELSRVFESRPSYFLDQEEGELSAYRVADDSFHFLNIQAGDLLSYKPSNLPRPSSLMLYREDQATRLCWVEYYQGCYYARVSAQASIPAGHFTWLGQVVRLTRYL